MRDPYGSDLLRHIADEMSGPMAEAVKVQSRPLDPGGEVALDAPLRECGMFLALRRDLESRSLAVAVRLVAPGPAGDLVPLRFASWTEAGAALALHVPPADPATETIAPFRLRLSGTLGGTDLDAAALRELVELRVVSGRIGKLIALLQAETVPIRRHARAVAAAGRIETASGDALDRHGADLGVPRFRNRLRLEPEGEVRALPEREDDVAYRARLALVRGFSMARPAQYTARLAADGPLSRIGPPVPLVIDEEDDSFSVAIRLVSVDDSPADAARRRRNFDKFLTDWLLIDPTTNIPTRRAMTAADAQSERALRNRLRQRLDIRANRADMAPELARTLDRATVLAAHMGVDLELRVRRAVAPDEGSRFELGLGVEIDRLSDARLAALAEAARGPVPDDTEAAATFRLLNAPATPADDPVGTWFFRACGFATVHRLSANRVYLSHTNVQGLAMTGDGSAPLLDGAAAITMAARFVPEGGGAGPALFSRLRAEALAGLPDATIVADGPAFAARGRAPTAQQNTRIRAAGLPAVTDWDAVSAALPSLPPDSWTLIELPDPQADALRAGQAEAWHSIGALVAKLRNRGLAAAAPVLTQDGAGLILSAVALPRIGSNLAGKASTGFRWFLVPLDDAAVQHSSDRTPFWIARPNAPETELRFFRRGLYAAVVLGYERRGATDPFEVRVRPEAEDARLSFAQYEYVMNLLALRAPAGVEISTWRLRQFHVAAETGAPVALDPDAARTFRRYLHPRHAGAPVAPFRPS